MSLTFVSKRRKVVIGLWATRILYGCGMLAIVSEVPFMYDIITVVTVEVLGLLSFGSLVSKETRILRGWESETKICFYQKS